MSAEQRPLPEGVVSAVEAADKGKAIKMSAEVVVVGTGAGGAAAFCALAEAGVDVLAVEMGAWAWPETSNEQAAWPHLLAEAGGRGTEDLGVVVFQGRAVGGSAFLGSNLCKRPHADLLAHWAERWGLSQLTDERFSEAMSQTEKHLGVVPITPGEVNTNNRLMLEGIERLGWRGGLMSRNREGCLGAYVHRALAAGGRMLVEARVDRVQRADEVVTGVSGYGVTSDTHIDVAPFVIEARGARVVLAASATASTAIVHRSSLPDPHGLAGSNLHLDPSAMVFGVFDGPDDPPIRGWEGISQAAECTEFLDLRPGSRRRVWLAGGFAHPATAAMFIPGFGPDHADIMRLYPRMAAVFAMVHDETRGRVLASRGQRAHIRYRPGASDLTQLALGLREAGRLLLSAGASRVLIPLSPPLWIRHEGALVQITPERLGPHCPLLFSNHPTSTLWMGRDPATSVVDERGEHHHAPGLYVADGALLPTSVGGPPQVLIYTLGRQVAEAVVESL